MLISKLKFFLVLFALLCLSGCSTTDSLEISNNALSRMPYSLNTETLQFGKYEYEYKQLDDAYTNEKEKAITTNELCDVEDKYIRIWKEELNIAVTELLPKLNDTDEELFLSLQLEWEQQLVDSMNFEYDILTNPAYQTEMGTSFMWLWRSEFREQYRERAMRIYYLSCLLDSPQK